MDIFYTITDPELSCSVFTVERLNYTRCPPGTCRERLRPLADSYDDQPDADWAAHKAVPIQAGLVLAGSIESIVITVYVTV